MQQLKPQDAQFLYLESGHNLTHVTAVLTFDPSTVPGGSKVRFKDIIAHVASRLAMSPLFRRRLVRVPLELDYPYWVDDEHFDIEYHMHHGRLPEPGDWRQFCIHMARYHARPLDMSRPLWEMVVVEGLDNIPGLAKGSYAIATKIHHAAVDGTSMVKFFGAISDIDAKGTPALPLDAAPLPCSERPRPIDILRRGIVNNLRSPVRLAGAISRAAPGLVKATENALHSRGKPKASVPKTRFNAKVSPHKMFDAVAFDLDALKAARQSVPGCTINDVVLAVCGGALRRYLKHHGELPEQSLVALVPINARSAGARDEPGAGNNISSMTAAIHTGEADPTERLRRIMLATRASKTVQAGISARLLTDLTQHVPAATQVMAARLVLTSGVAGGLANLIVSNVPGPQVPLYMNGARQVGCYGVAPLSDGMGLFINTPSYEGRMFFNVTSSREIMPDIEFFIDCLRASLAELQPAARTTRPRRARRTVKETQS